MHRWIWDLQYTPVAGAAIRLEDDELLLAARGVIALPGAYTVKLTVAGRTYSQPLTVKMDPRIKVSARGSAEAVRRRDRVSRAAI